MWKWMGLSLPRKLSVMMLFLTLIPLLSLGTFAYLFSSRVTEQKYKQSGIDRLRQMEGNLRYISDDVESMSLFIISDNDVQHYLSSPEDDIASRTRILNYTMNLLGSKDYISNITIYPADGKPPISTMNIYDTNLPSQINISEVREKIWTGLYSVSNYSGQQNVFSFIRPLRSFGNYIERGWLSISLDEKVVSRIWSEPIPDEGEGGVLLINREGVVLSATDKTQLSRPVSLLYPGIERLLAASGREGVVSGSMTYGEGMAKKTILYVKEPMLGWTLIGVTPYSVYSKMSRYILLLTAAAVAVTVMANSGLILFLVRRVTNPLRTLSGLLTRLDPNKPLPLYPVTSLDEIGRLAQSYNMLGEHIEKLKAQLIRDETRKKEADMRALQAQINPHFLYNTLSSIHWIALMNEEKRIADMVGALSDFLRFSLNKGKEYCTVQQELAHIRNYVQVQSIRFPDKFDVDYAVDPAILDRYMLKLVLQPLVENAMIHGVQRKEGKGHITVYVEQQAGRMSFAVMDDGVGMAAEKVAFIQSNLQADDGDRSPEASYGLRNVHERLRLHYGEGSGLTIESAPNIGTRISFAIPAREEEQHANHDRG